MNVFKINFSILKSNLRSILLNQFEDIDYNFIDYTYLISQVELFCFHLLDHITVVLIITKYIFTLSDKRVLELFVRGCRMDLDRARTKLEAYCLARARFRDLYEHRSLSSPPLNDVCKFM